MDPIKTDITAAIAKISGVIGSEPLWHPDTKALHWLRNIFSELNEAMFERLNNAQQDTIYHVYRAVPYNDLVPYFDARLLDKMQTLRSVVFDEEVEKYTGGAKLYFPAEDPVMRKWEKGDDPNEKMAAFRIRESCSTGKSLDLSNLELKELPPILFIDPRFCSIKINITGNPLRKFPGSITLDSGVNIRLCKKLIEQMQGSKESMEKWEDLPKNLQKEIQKFLSG